MGGIDSEAALVRCMTCAGLWIVSQGSTAPHSRGVARGRQAGDRPGHRCSDGPLFGRDSTKFGWCGRPFVPGKFFSNFQAAPSICSWKITQSSQRFLDIVLAACFLGSTLDEAPALAFMPKLYWRGLFCQHCTSTVHSFFYQDCTYIFSPTGYI